MNKHPLTDIYKSKYDYTFSSDLNNFDNYHISDKYYKSIFTEGELTIKPENDVIKEINRYIPPNFPFGNDRLLIGGGFMLKLVCKQFNIENYPETDIDIFVEDDEIIKDYFESIGYEERINKGPLITEYKLKNYKYTFQIIKCRIMFGKICKEFDFAHNEIFYNGNNIIGTELFKQFTKYQVSCSIKPSPNRVLKAFNLNLRLIDRYTSFNFYPDIFEMCDLDIIDDDGYFEKNRYLIKLDKIIPEKHLSHDHHTIKRYVRLYGIDIKYKNSEAHFNILKYFESINYYYHSNYQNIIQFKN